MEIVPDSVIPPLPLTERGFGLHLGGTLEKEPRLLYCSDIYVIQRNLENVNQVRINTQHGIKANVAKFSPNGEWVCSGDNGGQVYVWAHKSMVVKNQIVVGKRCLDIAWSKDGQRIVAVGAGKDDKGKVFPWNTNNKLGELGGSSKGFLSCDFKPNRPFRVITGGEDYGVYYYKGPPFKFETYNTDHKNYVTCVRFSPDGATYVSVSSDKQIFAFDAKTGTKLRVISDGKGKNNQHKGTIYELSFSPDGQFFITSSADKTCKVWDYAKGEVIHTYTFSDRPSKEDMQVSCIWLDKYLISVSLSGKINYLDSTFKQQRPIRILTGHRKSIADIDYDSKNNTIYTSDSDGRIVKTECKTGECIDINGAPHKGVGIRFVRVTCDNKSFYTVGVNDTVCKSMVSDTFDDEKGNVMDDKTIKLDGAARQCCAGNKNPNLFIVATHKNKIQFINDLSVEKEMKLDYTPVTCALTLDDKYLAISAEKNGGVYVYDVDDQKEVFSIQNKQYIRNDVICLAFTADGEYLATGDAGRAIWIWDIKNKQFDKPLNFNKGMKFHQARLSSLEFSPNGKQLLSSSAGGDIYLFTNPTEGKSDNIHIDNAFPSLIRKAMFLSQDKIVAIGTDSSIRFFNIQKK